MVNALFGPTSQTSRAKITAIAVVFALLVVAAVQLSANAGAGALTITRVAGANDSAGIDFNRNGTATSARYGKTDVSIAVGEAPGTGNDERVFYPFWVNDAMLSAVKGGGSATVSLRVLGVENLGVRRLVLEGYVGTINQRDDFNRSATKLATLTPGVGKLGVDVTALVKAMTVKDYLVLRLRLDALADKKDGKLTQVSVAMSETPTTANQPLLTVVGAAVTPPPSTPRTPPPPPTDPVPPADVPAPDVPASTATAAGTTVGASLYPVPSGAIVVSPSGDDAAAGTEAAPLLTLGRAVAKAPSGATIVLRAGSYHESVVIPSGKQLTVQSWPGEAVWLDGSVPVTSWAESGGRWHADGWTTKFDASPTYTRGAADSTAANWGFVNPSYPMAAHPDQIWINGVAQRQVGSLAEVVPGTFFHDEAANQLWLGSDPAGAEVRASDLIRALMIRSDASVVRGLGIRRYAPSVPDMGAVTVERPKVVVENVAITDSATTGLYVASASDVTLRNLYVARSGMLGFGGSYADNLTIDRVLSENNNSEHFNSAPVSGGAKVTRSRGVVVRDSIFRSNFGPGLWMDESVYDMKIFGNEMRDNSGHGTSLEISAKAVFANNIVTNNSGFGIKINNTSDVSVWNNTFVGNDRSINLVQDTRRPTSATTAGVDKRQPFPDPTMTWLNGPAVIVNNVIANQKSGTCMLCVEDYSKQRTAEQIGVTAKGNVYNRPTATSPSWLVVWSRAAANPATFTTLAAFQAATGQEAGGQQLDGASVVDAAGNLVANLASTAVPLPSAIGGLTGYPTGATQLGAWPR
ncbi:MAG: right-handed parallel beta-helix repeat-containing protein [Acidimicrobiia bacterium]